MAHVWSTCSTGCFDACLMESVVQRKELKEINPCEEHPITSGLLCPKGNKFLKYLYHSYRIKSPMAGAGFRWEPVDWSQALERVARTVEENPGKIAFLTGRGNRGLLSTLFPERIMGALNAYPFRSGFCRGNGEKALKAMGWADRQMDPRRIGEMKQVVFWGTNPKWSSLHHWFLVLKHKVRILSIDPLKTVTLKDSDDILRPRPGTDHYLAWAMARIFLEESWENEPEGFVRAEERERLKGWLLERVSLEEAAEITGISQESMRRTLLGLLRNGPGYFVVGAGLQRYNHGGETIRAVASLAALIGYGLSYQRDEEGEGERYLAGGALREGYPTHELFRWIDEGKVKVLFVFNANPVSTHPNSNIVKAALMKEGLTVIVSDLFFTDTTKFAHLILPSTSFFEHSDLVKSPWHPFLQVNQRAVEPLHLSHSLTDQFREIAKALKLEDPSLQESDEELISGYLSRAGLDKEELLREGFVPFRKEPVGDEPITLFFPPEGELPEEPLLDCEVVPEGAYRLISPGHRDLVSSQFFKITTNFLPDRVFVNAEEARKADLKSGDRVRVFNQRGAAEMTLEVKNEVPSGAILIYKAPWESQAGYSPNLFTDDTPSATYKGTGFYSTFVWFEKLEERAGAS